MGVYELIGARALGSLGPWDRPQARSSKLEKKYKPVGPEGLQNRRHERNLHLALPNNAALPQPL